MALERCFCEYLLEQGPHNAHLERPRNTNTQDKVSCFQNSMHNLDIFHQTFSRVVKIDRKQTETHESHPYLGGGCFIAVDVSMETLQQ